MAVLRDRARRSIAGSAVLRGGTVMISSIKITANQANVLTIGGASDTITIPGAVSATGNISGSTLTGSVGIRTFQATGTSPAGGVLLSTGGIIVGNLGGTPRIYANVGGTVYQFNGEAI